MTLTDENVGLYADTLVLQVKGGGRELDYSEASVEVLEDLLRASDELLRGENFPETQRNLLVFYNGCYLGEVMARALGGAWKFEENWYDSSLVFPHRDGGEEGGIQVFPFQKVYRRIAEGPAGNCLVAYYDGLKDRLGRGG
jgi:hypothetical protein